MKQDKLNIFLLTASDKWRTHDNKVFEYVDGTWEVKPCLEYDAQQILIATEGVFISPSEKKDLQWNWEAVCSKMQNQIEGMNEQDFMEKYCYGAKTNADHSKHMTKNKIYQAPWTSRVCDMFNALRVQFDHDMKNITN